MFSDTFKYNLAANQRIITAISEAQNTTPKILQLCSHILMAHKVWLTRISSPEQAAQLDPWLLIPSNEFLLMNEQLHLTTQLMLEDAGILENQVSYVNTKGQSFTNSVQEIFMHLLLHSTYHRGQVAQLLRANGDQPPVTDYIFYKRLQNL